MHAWFRIPTALALGACAAALLASPAAASDCAGATTPASAQSGAQLETSVICLINEERGTAGRRPVHTNAKLRQAALGHSSDMVANSYFEHTTPGGISFTDRLNQVGYMRGARSWLVGENLVWGTGERSTPEQLVESWMQSPPHRANLLRPRFREVGVAAVLGTPVDAIDSAGITVSSEYGVRTRHH
jgi:uncharacterized protein YkwD